MDDVKRSPDQRPDFGVGASLDVALQRRQAFLDARVQAAKLASLSSRSYVQPRASSPVVTDLRPRPSAPLAPKLSTPPAPMTASRPGPVAPPVARPVEIKPVTLPTLSELRSARQLQLERRRVAPDIGQFLAHEDLSLIPPIAPVGESDVKQIIRTRDDLLEQLSAHKYTKLSDLQPVVAVQPTVPSLATSLTPPEPEPAQTIEPTESRYVEHITEHEPEVALWRHELNRFRAALSHYRLARILAPRSTWVATRAIALVAIIWVGIIGLQFAVPGGLVAKSISYRGLVFSGQQPLRAAAGIDALRAAETITLTTAGDRAVTQLVGDGVVKVNADSLKVSISEYSWRARLQPGSVLSRSDQTVEPEFDVDQSSPELAALVESISSHLDQAGQAPAVSFDSTTGTSRVVPGVESVTHDRAEVSSKVLAILKSDQIAEDTVNFTVSSSAKATEAELAKKSDEYNAALTRKVTVKVDGVDIVIEGSDLSRLLTPVYFPQNSTQTLDQAVSEVAAKIAKSKSVAAKSTVVTLSQGSEVSRQQGSAGKTISATRLAAAIKQNINGNVAVAVTSQTIEPAIITKTLAAPAVAASNDSGLADVISRAVAGRGDIGVTVQELTGSGRRASLNGSKEYVTASTYKLLLTLAISKKLDSGSWNWSTRIAGTTLDKCFEKMIVISDNNCASAFGSGVGWLKAENMLKELGLKNTFLNNVQGDKHSTTDDEEYYMRRVATENILRQDLRDKLWDTGARQIYRSGIPAGSSGSKVVDKVGFYNGYLNDTGVVYGPKSTYSISIMTKNSSWGNIAYVAQEIYDYLNR